MKALAILGRMIDKCWFIIAYILSTYLFYLPWLPFWRESFQDDNGVTVMLATVMVFLSPLIFPLILGMMGLVTYMQIAENNPLLAVAAFFWPLLYYTVVLIVSVLLTRYLKNLILRRLTGRDLPATRESRQCPCD